MRLELYQAECERIARQNKGILDEVAARMRVGSPLSLLEQSGVLHTLQVLVENAIGKSKHWLKASDLPVPISAYDAFASLQQHGVIDLAALRQWNAAIGLRNRIVPDYMNVDMEFVGNLILNKKHHFIADFLERPIAAIRRVGDGGSRTIE